MKFVKMCKNREPIDKLLKFLHEELNQQHI